MAVILIPILSDNYAYLIPWDEGVAVVDPGAYKPVKQAIEKEGKGLAAILVTHHHSDHIGGLAKLAEDYSCPIYGPDDSRIVEVTDKLVGGNSFELGPYKFRVMSTPGHTTSHIVFHEPHHHWLFSGDTLFAGGCGRLFEGTPKQMWESLQKIRSLPSDTRVYCGHEYTENNLKFALSIESNNLEVAERLQAVRDLRKHGQPSIPATLKEECATNPFLRVDEMRLQNALGMEGSDPVEVFAKVRKLKDRS